MPRYNHMCSIAFTFTSDKKDGSDITKGKFLQAINKRLSSLNDDTDVHFAILPPEDTYMEQMSQDDFRTNPDKCVSCFGDSVERGDWDDEGGCVYQIRYCRSCGERWTASFTAESYQSHSD